MNARRRGKRRSLRRRDSFRQRHVLYSFSEAPAAARARSASGSWRPTASSTYPQVTSTCSTASQTLLIATCLPVAWQTSVLATNAVVPEHAASRRQPPWRLPSRLRHGSSDEVASVHPATVLVVLLHNVVTARVGLLIVQH